MKLNLDGQNASLELQKDDKLTIKLVDGTDVVYDCSNIVITKPTNPLPEITSRAESWRGEFLPLLSGVPKAARDFAATLLASCYSANIFQVSTLQSALNGAGVVFPDVVWEHYGTATIPKEALAGLWAALRA